VKKVERKKLGRVHRPAEHFTGEQVESPGESVKANKTRAFWPKNFRLENAVERSGKGGARKQENCGNGPSEGRKTEGPDQLGGGSTAFLGALFTGSILRATKSLGI